MRPAISEAICTDSSDCRLPMARMSVVVVAPRALAASTAMAPPAPLPLPRPFSTVLPGTIFSAVEICTGCGVLDRVAAQTMSPRAATTASPTTILRRMSLPRPSAC